MRSTWNAGAPRGDLQKGTIGVVVALVASFLASWFLSGSGSNPVYDLLAYSPDLSQPWTLFTYPFGALLSGVFWFAIGCWVLYQFMSSLERQLGTLGVVLFFFVMTFLGGLGYFVGTQIAGTASLRLPTVYLPLEVIVFTWCLVNSTAQINLFMVIPVPAKVLMWLCVAAVVIEHGWGAPIVGLFAALPVLASWLYTTGRIPGMKFGRVPDLTSKKEESRKEKEFDRFMTDVKRREQERDEKERLRRLFEDSLSDEDEKKD